MKKLSTHLKYFILTLALIVGSFSIASTASADTYTYNCSASNGGGTVTSEVNLTPGTAPYVFGPNQTFNATGQITTSNCSVNQVSLTARNNFGSDENLISATAIGSSASIPALVPASQTFATPANACSLLGCPYAVYFITGVDETLPTFTGFSASSMPIQGGTNDTNIACDAQVSGLGSAVSITGTYNWSIYDTSAGFGNVLIESGMDHCTVYINPATGLGDDRPGTSYSNVNSQDKYVTFDSICWDSADAPVDPSIPHC